MVNMVLVSVSVALAIAADLWLAVLPTRLYPGIWLLTLVSGLLFLPSAWRGAEIGIIGAIVSALHTIVLYLATQADNRTFFGGKMVPMIAACIWLLVCMLIVAATATGKLKRRAR